jgi:DNA replication protein DnaC
VIKAPADICPLCEGTGWKTVPAASNARPSTKNDRRVTRCDCQLRARAQSLLAAARIPRRYEHCELEDFDPHFEGGHPSLERALLDARGLVLRYPLEKTGLLLIGSAGLGKTHLAVGILKKLVREKGIACLFCDYRELLKQIQNSYNASVQTTELDVLRPVFETEVLVLDELGAIRPTDWVWDTVSLILNSRYNDQLTTIITTNFPNGPSAKADRVEGPRRSSREDTLGDRIGDRMLSRLHEMCRIVELQGVDFRQKVMRHRIMAD